MHLWFVVVMGFGCSFRAVARLKFVEIEKSLGFMTCSFAPVWFDR